MITVQAGEPLSLDVPPLTALGLPVAVTSSWSARVQVRPDRRSTRVLHEWSTSGATPNAAIVAGVVRLTATAAVTGAWQDTWPPGPAMWDLLLTEPDGTPHTIPLGVITLALRVTR